MLEPDAATEFLKFNCESLVGEHLVFQIVLPEGAKMVDIFTSGPDNYEEFKIADQIGQELCRVSWESIVHMQQWSLSKHKRAILWKMMGIRHSETGKEILIPKVVRHCPLSIPEMSGLDPRFPSIEPYPIDLTERNLRVWSESSRNFTISVLFKPTPGEPKPAERRDQYVLWVRVLHSAQSEGIDL
jgi:hypothetical protein